MKHSIAIITALLLLLSGCISTKPKTIQAPYSVEHKVVKELYQEIPLSAENIDDYYEFAVGYKYNENTGCFEYTGCLRPKANIYTCMDSEEIQISYSYQQNTYNCIYDVTTGEIVDKGQPTNIQPVNVTEYINPYFSMQAGIISADYIISLDKNASSDEGIRYQKIQITFNENIDITDCKGTLCIFTADDKLPWLYTHKAHDAFYGNGNYKLLQIETTDGYCTLVFNNDNRRNVSARYFFDDGTSSGSLSMKDILNDGYYGSLVTERGEKYILK